MRSPLAILLIFIFFLSSYANGLTVSEEEAQIDARERQIRHELHQLNLRRKRNYKEDRECCEKCISRGGDASSEACCQRLLTTTCPYRDQVECEFPSKTVVEYKNDQQCCRQCILRGGDVNNEECCQRIVKRQCPLTKEVDCGIQWNRTLKIKNDYQCCEDCVSSGRDINTDQCCQRIIKEECPVKKDCIPPAPRPTVYIPGEYTVVTKKKFTTVPVCPPHERFTECLSECELTCATFGLNIVCDSQRCIEYQVCECEHGRVRNSYGKCVYPQDCPKPVIRYPEPFNEDEIIYRNRTIDKMRRKRIDKVIDVPKCTKPFEHYEKCGTHPSCEPNCDVTDKRRINCPHKCIEQICVCDEGYVRDHHGNCIYAESCTLRSPSYPRWETDISHDYVDEPYTEVVSVTERVRKSSPKCTYPNEELKECGTACEPRCGNHNTPFDCNSQDCIENVCQCKYGYVRNDEGDCVLPHQCPKRHISKPINEPREEIIHEKILLPGYMRAVDTPTEPRYEPIRKTCCDRCAYQKCGCVEEECTERCDRCRCNHSFVSCQYPNQVRG